MSVLSITFHVESNVQMLWSNFMETEFYHWIDSLSDVEKYIFSEVDSLYIDEGKNYNLLMIFHNLENRNTFLSNTIENLRKSIYQKFSQEEVLIFITELNSKRKRF
ncbi:DUF4286 family protein [Elizabethkingia argentiflava]|uniref:DUF4286 family protein n=1 Tax=Elizabethkingia argenteiflava TaxID=2681556 RepID=A0A845PUZ5_9FLAO|nr:DUF4286 family protein [Elizabethkingia argenteiflava]NAW50923.1 DUF4286 family protein [Elizabethkingia argenteiflava]